MRIIAIVPARAGSTRLPGKNTRSFCGGYSLVQRAVHAAVECGLDTYVTTNDAEVIEQIVWPSVRIARRPPELAGGAVPFEPVVQHVLDLAWKAACDAEDAWGSRFAPPEAFVLLQPTSPLRTQGDIRRAVALLEVGAPGVISVNTHEFIRASWMGRGLPEKTLTENGAIYAATVAEWVQHKSFRVPGARLLPMDPISSVDVDTAEDWAMATVLCEARERLEAARRCTRTQPCTGSSEAS